MANWIDFLSLVAVISLIGGVIYGVIYVVGVINEGVNSTKQSLKSRGLDVSANGVSVKTSRRFDRDDYVDATQRGILKAVNAASFRKGNGESQPVAPPMQRETSSSSFKSVSSEDKKKKKSMFGTKK